jgi:hypothetical protein
MSAGASDVLLRLLRRAAARRPVPERMSVEEVEPRILHSADLAPIVIATAAGTQAEMRVLDAVPVALAFESTTQQVRRHELVIVDAQTPDYENLIDDIRANADASRELEVVVLGRGSDGVREITDLLAARIDLDALHIISHGTDGAIYLGRDTLDVAALASRGAEIESWGSALKPDADILLYGCDVAQTAKGQSLVQGLAQLTGADVASSDDTTGAAARGGDWVLEYRTGAIEAQVALSAAAELTWSGTLANTAPVVAGSGNLPSISEDPATNAGERVALLIAARVTDADAGALAGIAVTGVDNANGSWQYSTDSKNTWTAFGAPSASNARLLAADNATYVRFVPNANWNGTVVNGLTFRAWDQTSGVAGGTADTTSVTRTVRDNFGAVSYSNNDGTATWTAGWVDSDANPSSGNIRVSGGVLTLSTFLGTDSIYREANLAGAGSATLSFSYNNQLGALGTVSLQISKDGGTSYTTLASTFVAGASTYSADVSAYIASNTRIRFAMNGTVLGGSFAADDVQISYVTPLNGGSTAFSAATASSGITVTSVNDPPVGADYTVVAIEGAPFVFNVAHFGFSDPNDTPANALLTVKIQALAGPGVLTLNGTAVIAGQYISPADIVAGKLVYTPAANGVGVGYASFQFKVQDDGGGSDTDQNRTITINVAPVNSAPRGADNTVTAVEDTTTTLTASMFGFIDPNDAPANNLLSVKITSAATAGTLALNGVAVIAGQSVGVADIDAGKLTFRAAADAAGAGYATFGFRVQDDGGTLDGGVDLDPLARTMTINVTSVNDAPAGTSNTVTASEDTPFVFNAAAFGFSDVLDSPANALSAVRIVTVPGAGSLTLNGAAVTAGQTVSAANIAAGNLVFSPAPNSNGAGYASFTFRVQDDGGTLNGGVDIDPLARTMTVDVTPVNDAPVISTANNLTTINEDDVANPGTLVSVLAASATDIDTGALKGIAVTAVDNANGTWQYTLNGGGTWLDFGEPRAGTARLLAADASTLVRFKPDPNWNGTVGNGLSFRAWDRTLGTSGGVAPTIANPVLLDSFDTISYANQDGTANWSTDWVDVDSDPTSGRITADNGALRIKTKDSPTSVYRGADLGFATGATLAFSYVNPFSSSSDGTLVIEASSDSGATYTTLGTFSNTLNTGSGTFSADLSGYLSANTRIQFRLVADSDRKPNFLVDDVRIASTGLGNGGTTAFSAAVVSSSIDVRSVNDAPAGTSTTVTTNEDTPLVFTTGSFGFTDPRDSPANALLAVKVTALASAGALTLSGVAVTAGQTISAASIAAGNLVFTAAANANGAGYASFTFQVQDGGGTANGGVDLDTAARTMTIDVRSVNDAPVGTGSTVTIDEDSPFVFSAASFGFTDAADAPATALLAVKIAAVPTAGALTLDGAAVTAGQFVSAADIDAGKLVYTPAANGSGAAYGRFTFQVRDDGGILNGGVDLDPVARTMTIAVTPVNDAPVGASATLTMNEDSALVLSAASFGFSDANDAPGNALAAVRIVTLQGAGSLTLGGVAVTAGQLVTAANIAAGRLVYTAAPNASGTAYASFTFQVQDDGGTANGGVDFDVVARTLTIDVRSVNDAPSGTSRTFVIAEDTPRTLAAVDFGFTDTNDTPANAFTGVRISSLPTAGALRLDGVAVTAGQVVSIASIDAGDLVYTPAANANGAAAASFGFRVQDSGGRANGGVDRDPITRTITFDVTAVNDAPVGTNKTVFTAANTPIAFDVSHFGFTDTADSPADNFIAVTIDALPAQGTLSLSGLAVSAGQSIAVADLSAGRLVYTPGVNGTGAAYSSFGFRVRDDGGGSDLDAIARTMTINVGVLNKAPAGASNTLVTREDTPVVFDTAAFGYSDLDDTPANAFVAVRISSLPAAGALTLGGVAVTAGQSVSVADIGAGRLAFTPAANASGAAHASFAFQVEDDGAGITLDPIARTMTIDVTPVNDAPAGADATLATNEDTPLTISAAAFGFSDSTDTVPNSMLAVRIASLPGAGVLALNGVAVTAGEFVSAADLAAGRLTYTPALDQSGTGYASFTFQVQDGGGTADGGADLDAIERTLTINVAAVNDAPSGSGATLVVAEDSSFVFSSAVFGFGDGSDSNAMLAVRITTLPAQGSLTLNGAAVSAGQFIAVGDLDGGGLVYTAPANANGAAFESFTFQVRDDGGTARGGVDLDASPDVLVFDVTPVNDAPRGTSATVEIPGDAAYVVRAATFGFTDPDDAPPSRFAAVRIAALPAVGNLALAGSAVAAGQLVSVADIHAGALTYTPDAGAVGASYAAFTFQVQDDGGGSDTDPVARTLTFDVTPPAPPPTPPHSEPAGLAETFQAPATPAPPVDTSAPQQTVAAAPAAAPAPAAVAPAKAAPPAADLAPSAPELQLAGTTTEQGSGAGIMRGAPVQSASVERPSRDSREAGPTFVPLAQALLGIVADSAQAATLGPLAAAHAAKPSAVGAAENQALNRALDQMREGLEEQGRLEATTQAASAAVGVSMSVGYVVWLLRGGVMLSTLLSSLPAWRMVDPLPVLGRMDEDDEDDEDDDSLEALVARNNAPTDAEPASPDTPRPSMTTP